MIHTDKKGELGGQILVILVLAAILLVTITFLVKDAFDSGQKFLNEKCAREIWAYSQANHIFGETEIYCPTDYKTLHGDEEEIKQSMSLEMVKCWNTWRVTNESLFQEEEGVFCHVCSVFDFDDKELEIDGLVDYMKENEYEGKPFIQHIIPYSTEDIEGIREEVISSDPDFIAPLMTDGKHAVIFKYIKGKDKIIAEMQKETALKGMSALLGVGLTYAGAKTGATVGAAICSPAAVIGSIGCGIIGGVIGGGIGAGIGAAGVFFIDDDQDVFAYVSEVEFDEENLRDLGCEATPARQQKDLNT